ALDRVHHLLGGRYPGRGDEDEELDLVGRSRGKRADPAPLADPPEADVGRIDGSQHRERVVDLNLEPPAGGVAGGLALPATVERDDADAGRGQQVVQVRVRAEVTRAFACALKRDDHRLARRRVARGQLDVAAADAQVFHFSSLGSGREWTRISRVV